MDVDTTRWSGDGSFTQVLIDALRDLPDVLGVRVEDAPASRAETGYNFIANELYVTFATEEVREPRRVLGFIPYWQTRRALRLDLDGLGASLTAAPHIGEPDYADPGMIQYLRTERVVAPYQTKGIKVIELVRIYRADAVPR